MTKQARKSILSLVLAAALCVSMLPAAVFAEDSSADAGAAAEAANEQTQGVETTADGGSDNTAISDENTGNTGNDAAAEVGTETGNSENTDATDEDKDEDETPAYTGRRLKSLTRNGFKLQFTSNYVQADNNLNAYSEPTGKSVKTYKKSRKITWKVAKKTDTIDGYIILKRSPGSKTYKQIAKVGKNTKSYTDKSVKKGKKYYYTIVGYKTVGDDIRISSCSGYGRMPGRAYQNPTRYVQISDSISKHGLSYYTSPVLVDKNSTKSEHIEAMIKTAYKYKGDKYVVCRSGKPGAGLDCSGLVMQACYGAGVDLWPVNPYRHRSKKYEYESRNIAKMSTLQTVSYKNRKRGDLIFFANSRGKVIHVAIYLGNNKIIHSTSVGGRVRVTGMGGGAYGKVCKVKRVFN